jgi:N-acetylglucosamine-6-sulfatase
MPTVRREWLWSCVLWSWCVAGLGGAERPNVVVILTDDQRWDALGIAGHPHLKTPWIDRLAREGVFFEQAFCTTSLCSPSRASILSGLYAHGHGVVNNFTEYPADLASFPRQLQQAGYRTAYIGKWHMGEDNDNPRPGFDHFVTHKGQGKYFDTEFNVNGAGARVIPGYYTNVVTDLATEWLGEQTAQPFLLMLGHKAPHSFYTPEPKHATAFDHVEVPYPASAFQLDDKPAWFALRRNTWHGIYGPLFDFRKQFPDSRPEAVKDFTAMTRAYWATLLSVDESVGRIYEALAAAGRLEETVILFTGDNGLLNGEHGMVDKRTMHEPSIRVPLIARYPGLTPTTQPRRVAEMVLHVDLAPSLLELCAAESLPRIHGRSWVGLVREGDPHWRTSWYYEYNYEPQFPYTPNIRGVRTRDWKYIRAPRGEGRPDEQLAELYHLATDPGETRNLIRDPRHADKLRELQVLLFRRMAETGAFPDRMPSETPILDRLPDLKIR